MDSVNLTEQIDHLVGKIRDGFRKVRPDTQTYLQELTKLVATIPETHPSYQASTGKMNYVRGLEMARVEGNHADAIAILKDALTLLQTTNSPKVQIWLLHEIGRCYNFLGQNVEAAECYHQIIDAPIQDTAQDTMCTAYYGLGNCYYSLQDFEQAYQYHAITLQLSKKYDDKYYECLALSSLGHILGRQAKYKEGIVSVLQALQISEEHQLRKIVIYCHRYLTSLYQEDGQYEQALAHGKIGIELVTDYQVQTPDTVAAEHSHFLLNIANIYNELDEYDEALTYLKRAHLLIEQFNDLVLDNQSHIYKLTANIYAKLGNHSQAYDNLQKYLHVSEQYRGDSVQKQFRALEARLVREQTKRESEIQRLHNLELSAKNEYLHAVVQEKGNILNIVSHDLKNPLTAIQLACNSLLRSAQKNDNNEREVKRLERIRGSAGNMADIISSLLEMQCAEHRLSSLSLESMEIVPLVRELLEQYEPIAKAKQITLLSDISASAHIVLANPTMARQVIDNLLSNAIKFSFPNTVVKLIVQSSSNGTEITISDQGQGLTQDDISKLFTKFAKLSAKPTNDESSTGLGLYIVKLFVDAMGGHICAESGGKDQGSKFAVRFCREQSEYPAHNEQKN